jgi:hypothetical protein
MFTFDHCPVDLPQLTPWMRHQQEWWRTMTRLPSPPSRQRESHEPLSYDETERLRTWRREAEDVVERYEAYLRTPAGQQDLSDLDQSRQAALESIAIIAANDATGECRQRFLNAGPFVAFLRDTSTPAIALLKAELQLKLADCKRDLHDRPTDNRRFINAEEAFTERYQKQVEAIRVCESLISHTYATHTDALEIIAKVRKAMSAVSAIRLETVVPVLTEAEAFPYAGVSPTRLRELREYEAAMGR